jgi:hypothetical protein
MIATPHAVLELLVPVADPRMSGRLASHPLDFVARRRFPVTRATWGHR